MRSWDRAAVIAFSACRVDLPANEMYKELSVTGRIQMDDLFKLSNMENSSTLFEKVIPVRITKGGSEDRHMDLTARFIIGASKAHRTTKVLQVQITNELDPFFLYTLEVSEDDFQSLKVEQCILVDFATFPYKFIELLEQCIFSGCNDSPRFLAILNLRTGDSTFSVVETNQFKHLSHLSLCFRQGNDSTIKAYLAGRLSEFKAINMDLHEKLRRTLLSLEKASRDVASYSSELAELKDKHNRSLSELKADYALEIAHEKEKVMRETTDLKDKLQQERSELEARLRQQADAEHERASELDKQVRTLVDAKYKLDAKVTELRTNSLALDKDLDEKQQECERLRRENRNLDSEKHESAIQLNRHLIRLSALEQEVQDKNDLIANLTMQIDNQASHRSALEGSWKEAQAAADRAEERATASASEISKCYQVIEKLQVELRGLKSKVKLKGQVNCQQDSLLQEKQSAVDKGLLEIQSLRRELGDLKNENEGLKRKADDLQGKLDEAQELLKSNQLMIQWLNQQLTEAQLGKLGTVGISSRYNYRPASGLAYSPNVGLTTGAGTPHSPSTSFGGNNTSYGAPFVPPLHIKPASNGLVSGLTPTFSNGVANRPCCIAKAAAASASLASNNTTTCKVQYKPSHLAKPSAGIACSASGCSLGTDSAGPMSWPDDTCSWVSKVGSGVVLPRPQLSFADNRSAFQPSNGRSTQSHSPRPESPKSQSPRATSPGPHSPHMQIPLAQSPRPLSPTVKSR